MSDPSRLRALGWDDWFQDRFDQESSEVIPARVAVQHKKSYLLLTEHGERWAEPSGRLLHLATHRAELPVVGDWVGLRTIDAQSGQIVSVVERRTTFSRLEAGSRVESPSDGATRSEQQVLAANLDMVMVVSSVTEEFNVRRIERYLTMIFEGGAMPFVLLNKSDLRDPASAVRQLAQVVPAVEVLPISAMSGEGFEQLPRYLQVGKTIALVGSSGVGKTSIVNRLVSGIERKVQPTREDERDRGRHTTTHRELVQLPSGGMIVDTPGMRELHLWEGADGIDRTFQDITELGALCRFSDCAHDQEPGCAVKIALEEGQLEPARYSSFRKLMREMAHLKRRQDPRLEREERERWKSISKQMRKRSRPTR